jgi:hypothetical protein
MIHEELKINERTCPRKYYKGPRAEGILLVMCKPSLCENKFKKTSRENIKAPAVSLEWEEARSQAYPDEGDSVFLQATDDYASGLDSGLVWITCKKILRKERHLAFSKVSR